METARMWEGARARKRESNNILPPREIITHSPLRDLELPGCHFDTVRGIKDIPRARYSWSAINLWTGDYADLDSELPRRRNRCASLDGGDDYREEWFVGREGCASLRDRTWELSEEKWFVAKVNRIVVSNSALLNDRENFFKRIFFHFYTYMYIYIVRFIVIMTIIARYTNEWHVRVRE